MSIPLFCDYKLCNISIAAQKLTTKKKKLQLKNKNNKGGKKMRLWRYFRNAQAFGLPSLGSLPTTGSDRFARGGG